jgi:hypothetical protein
VRIASHAVLALAAAAATLSPRGALAQGGGASPPAARRGAASGSAPAADPRDVRSLDAILAALYDVISGPVGQPRDWARFRSLFAAGGRLVPTERGADGMTRPTVLTPEQFERRAAPALAKAGFYEREIGRRTDRFGAVVHVMSAYESKHAPTDARPFARGVNSIQLLDAGDRWYVVTLLWDSERPDAPIPAEYLAPPAPAARPAP